MTKDRVAFARQLRQAATAGERALWSLLRGRRFRHVKFRRQVPLGPYVADFVSYEFRLVIEVDGPVHEGRAQADARRDAWMRAEGFVVLRFPADDVVMGAPSVEAAIAAVLDRTPSPRPPLRSGDPLP